MSLLSQWTMRQKQDLQKKWVACINGALLENVARTSLDTLSSTPASSPGAASSDLTKVNRAIMDYTYLTQYPAHTASTILELKVQLFDWQSQKDIFWLTHRRIDREGNNVSHFNIPKFHIPFHIADYIHAKGRLDQQSTKTSKQYHPIISKHSFRLTNHRGEYEEQML